MKYILSFLFFLLISACNTGNENTQNNSKCDSLCYSCIQDKIKESENAVNQQKCDLESLKAAANQKAELGIIGIPVLENRVKHCLPQLNQAEKDSVYVLFSSAFDKAIASLNDSLYSQYKELVDKLEKNTQDAQIQDFKKSINACGADLLTTEGSFYIGERFDYLYNLFKGNVSPALENYLKIRSNELKTGFSEDAGLMISWEDLYSRVINWEDFIGKYPDFFLNEQAEFEYKNYLITLLSGMDNTPVFDFETYELTPEVKILYQKIISENRDRKSTKIISEYYNLLKINGFKQPEDFQRFFDEHGLSSPMDM